MTHKMKTNNKSVVSDYLKMTYDPNLDKYAGVLSEHDKRAKAILERVGLPPQIVEAQAAKEQAAQLCDTLKQHRQRQHLSQTDLAQKVGMQKEFISRIENGKVDVQLSTLLRIASGLGLRLTVE